MVVLLIKRSKKQLSGYNVALEDLPLCCLLLHFFVEEFHLLISWSFTPHIWFLCLFMVLSLYFSQNVLITFSYFSLFLFLSFSFFFFLFSFFPFLKKNKYEKIAEIIILVSSSCAIVLSEVFPYMIIEVQYTVVFFFTV